MATKAPVVPGEPADQAPEVTADADAVVGSDSESPDSLQNQLDMMSDRIIALEKAVTRLVNATVRQPAAAVEPIYPTQDEALAKAKESGRAVMSRDGLIVPPVV